MLAAVFSLNSAVAGNSAIRPALAESLLYAVDQAPGERGSISVYDIDRGHRLVKTLTTVGNVADVKGIAVGAVTGRLYVAYRDEAGTGRMPDPTNLSFVRRLFTLACAIAHPGTPVPEIRQGGLDNRLVVVTTCFVKTRRVGDARRDDQADQAPNTEIPQTVCHDLPAA